MKKKHIKLLKKVRDKVVKELDKLEPLVSKKKKKDLFANLAGTMQSLEDDFNSLIGSNKKQTVHFPADCIPVK